MIILSILNFAISVLQIIWAHEETFPESVSFGVSSAAYQVEGGWDANGKGENIWDHLLHTNPDFSYQQANGDVAADTYHHGVKDITYLTAMGLKHYRFSISWSRILPTGKKNQINEKGIKYYNNLINGLIAANITPIVTLYHWDLPQPLQNEGGWLNRTMIQYFEDYSKICFQRFGDRVKDWITFNEPISTCKSGYEDGDKAPALKLAGTGAYDCAHVVLLSHGHTYRLYEKYFKTEQKGSGWLRYTPWAFPELLKYIKNKFNNPEIFITENGYSGANTLKDDDRVKYIRGYLQYLLKAIKEDKINVTGYTYWSFLDDFEWTAGYLAKFGIIQIDFDNDARTRSRRYSSYVYENIVKTRKVDWNYTPEWPPK